MKVKELIQHLSIHDDEAEVVVWDQLKDNYGPVCEVSVEPFGIENGHDVACVVISALKA